MTADDVGLVTTLQRCVPQVQCPTSRFSRGRCGVETSPRTQSISSQILKGQAKSRLQEGYEVSPRGWGLAPSRGTKQAATMPDYIKVTISYPIQHEQRSERSPEACSPALAEGNGLRESFAVKTAGSRPLERACRRHPCEKFTVPAFGSGRSTTLDIECGASHDIVYQHINTRPRKCAVLSMCSYIKRHKRLSTPLRCLPAHLPRPHAQCRASSRRWRGWRHRRQEASGAR